MRKRVVLITGASSGIGYETALAFVRSGDDVIGTARRVERLHALAAKIGSLPGEHGDFLPVACDVRDGAAMASAIQQGISHFGRLDILIANAGLGHRGALVEADWHDIETVMRTNMDGVLHSIRASVPAMRQQGGGRIILVSSVVYNMTSPYAAIYAASKAFVSSIGRSLRLELEPDNIQITDMLVGRTESEFDEKRLGEGRRTGSSIPVMSTEQVASAILKASMGTKKAVTLRWLDRFLLLGNVLLPDFIGRKALRQYR